MLYNRNWNHRLSPMKKPSVVDMLAFTGFIVKKETNHFKDALILWKTCIQGKVSIY